MERITGLMVYYYFVCQKKLWYHMKNVNMEWENENVKIGKILDEYSYNRENKHISIDGVINIDFVKKWSILHDIKKSKSIEQASMWQMKYYLYYLQQKGINVERGIIDYPLLKERVDVFLTYEDIVKLENIILEINNIKKLKLPPQKSINGICSKCAYYEYCYC